MTLRTLKLFKDILHPPDMIAMRVGGDEKINITDTLVFQVSNNTRAFICLTCIDQDGGPVILDECRVPLSHIEKMDRHPTIIKPVCRWNDIGPRMTSDSVNGTSCKKDAGQQEKEREEGDNSPGPLKCVA